MKRFVLLAALALTSACTVTIEDACQHAIDCDATTGSLSDCVSSAEASREMMASCAGAQDAFDDLIACSDDLSCDDMKKDPSATDCKDADKALQDKLTACTGNITP